MHPETYVDKTQLPIAEQLLQLEVQASMENSQTTEHTHLVPALFLVGAAPQFCCYPFPWDPYLACSLCVRDLPKGSLLSSSCYLPFLSSHLYSQRELLKGTCSMIHHFISYHTSYLHPCSSRMVPCPAAPRSIPSWIRSTESELAFLNKSPKGFLCKVWEAMFYTTA